LTAGHLGFLRPFLGARHEAIAFPERFLECYQSIGPLDTSRIQQAFKVSPPLLHSQYRPLILMSPYGREISS